MSSVFHRPRYAKVGMLGFPGSGKTFGGIQLAGGLLRYLKTNRPLRVYDSEDGVSYQVDRVKAITGLEPEGVRSQSFADLVNFQNQCQEGDVVLIDSITHPWRELLGAHQQHNKGLQAIMKAKEQWADEFTKWYLSSPCHIIFCGRAGFEFDEIKDEKGNWKLVKTGTKMKVESEVGFEPSLLLEAERSQRKEDGVEVHDILVRKDRFSLFDGRRITFLPERRVLEDLTYCPVFDAFQPWFDRLDLSTGGPTGMDTAPKTMVDDGGTGWQREREQREILLGEIKDDLTSAWPGQSADEKKLKVDVIREAFGAGWSSLESNLDKRFPSVILRAGREKLQKIIAEKKKEAE